MTHWSMRWKEREVERGWADFEVGENASAQNIAERRALSVTRICRMVPFNRNACAKHVATSTVFVPSGCGTQHDLR